MYINESIKMIFKSVILDPQEATEAQEFFSRLDNKTKKSIGSNLWKRPFIWTFFRQNKPKANISSKIRNIIMAYLKLFFQIRKWRGICEKSFYPSVKYPAFSLVKKSQCGNFMIFSVTQILRETNLGESKSSKTAIFAIIVALIMINLVNFSLQKVQKFIRYRNSEPLNVFKW